MQAIPSGVPSGKLIVKRVLLPPSMGLQAPLGCNHSHCADWLKLYGCSGSEQLCDLLGLSRPRLCTEARRHTLSKYTLQPRFPDPVLWTAWESWCHAALGLSLRKDVTCKVANRSHQLVCHCQLQRRKRLHSQLASRPSWVTYPINTCNFSWCCCLAANSQPYRMWRKKRRVREVERQRGRDTGHTHTHTHAHDAHTHTKTHSLFVPATR